MQTLNYYTFYLLNGKRKVFLGTSPEDAYLNNQCYKDGQRAIGIQEQGITMSHRWSSEEEGWVPNKPFEVTVDSLKGISNLQIFLAMILADKNSIIAEFPNKSKIAVSVEWGHFIFGWTHYIVISYLEYNRGSYDGSDPNGCHYMVTNSEYFRPSKGNQAIDTFVKRMFHEKPFLSLAENESLELIHNEQSSLAMYDPNITEFEKVWLLGSLLKRLDNLPEIMKYVKDGYISRVLGEKDIWISDIMNQILCLCDDILITDKGQRALFNEKFITDHFHFKFKTGESDRFGPLSMIIQLNNFKFVYG